MKYINYKYQEVLQFVYDYGIEGAAQILNKDVDYIYDVISPPPFNAVSKYTKRSDYDSSRKKHNPKPEVEANKDVIRAIEDYYGYLIYVGLQYGDSYTKAKENAHNITIELIESGDKHLDKLAWFANFLHKYYRYHISNKAKTKERRRNNYHLNIDRILKTESIDTTYDYKLKELLKKSASTPQCEIIEHLENGYSLPEISELLGVSKQAVQQRLFYLRRRLDKLNLRDYYLN